MVKFPKFKYYLFIFDVFIFLISFLTTALILRTNYNLTLFQIFFPDIRTISFAFLAVGIFLFIYQYNSLYKINIIITRAAHLNGNNTFNFLWLHYNYCNFFFN